MKKGFTLIELLSVIVVIAIISVIAIPTLLGVVNKAKLGALKSSAYGLIEAGTLYNAEYANSNNVRFDIKNNIVSTTETNKLKYKGNVKQGTVIVSTKGQVSVCVTDGKNSAYKNYNDTEVTLVSKKTCTIPASTYIVYLDGTATRNELTNLELTSELESVKERLSKLESKNQYPVGSYYIAENDSNPHDLFGGEWEKVEGRFLLGSSDNYAVNSTGGEATHTLTVAEMPSHTHNTPYHADIHTGTTYGHTSGGSYVFSGVSTGTYAAGGSQPHNNMPPYLVVNIWKRTV